MRLMGLDTQPSLLTSPQSATTNLAGRQRRQMSRRMTGVWARGRDKGRGGCWLALQEHPDASTDRQVGYFDVSSTEVGRYLVRNYLRDYSALLIAWDASRCLVHDLVSGASGNQGHVKVFSWGRTGHVYFSPPAAREISSGTGRGMTLRRGYKRTLYRRWGQGCGNGVIEDGWMLSSKATCTTRTEDERVPSNGGLAGCLTDQTVATPSRDGCLVIQHMRL